MCWMDNSVLVIEMLGNRFKRCSGYVYFINNVGINKVGSVQTYWKICA